MVGRPCFGPARATCVLRHPFEDRLALRAVSLYVRDCAIARGMGVDSLPFSTALFSQSNDQVGTGLLERCCSGFPVIDSADCGGRSFPGWIFAAIGQAAITAPGCAQAEHIIAYIRGTERPN